MTTYQIYLAILGYIAENGDDEMIKAMLTELYKKAKVNEAGEWQV